MSTVYLIPSILHEDGLASIPSTIPEAVRDCQVFFAENERSARRYFKMLWKEMVIDDYEWYGIHKAENEVRDVFIKCLEKGKNIGIVSEAGCPGVADPGQILIALAQERGVTVRPLTGPSSVLLALMASGMNGQHFRFNGYLPIDQADRVRAIQELETESQKKNCTEIFIETPYRNNQLLETLLKTCKSSTRICVAVDLTSGNESVKTKTVEQWRKNIPGLHKKLVIFLLQA